MNETMVHYEGFAARSQKVLQVARELFQGKPDWVTFFRETLGINGAARTVFPTQNEYLQFEQSPEFSEIQQMLMTLRSRKIPGNGTNEPTRVITVRLPESLHEALKQEATDHKTSMNKLCISKLLQVLSDAEKAAAPTAAKPVHSRVPVPSPSAGMKVPPPVPAPSRSLPPVPRPSAPVSPVPKPAAPSFRSTYNQDNRYQ